MTSGQIVGKMDTQKQLNVPLDRVSFGSMFSVRSFVLRARNRLAEGAELIEWYIKLFLGVHFAANWVSVH